MTGDDVDPELVALDLIAQAEHDPLARTYLIATDEAVIAKVASARGAGRGRGPPEIVDAALRGRAASWCATSSRPRPSWTSSPPSTS